MSGLFSSSELQELLGPTGPGNSASPIPVEVKPKNIFEKKKRISWYKSPEQAVAARCDLSVQHLTMTPHSGIPVVSLWRKSIKGRTLVEIKSDDTMVEFFSSNITDAIRAVLGHYLPDGGWAICATPRRRHLTKNFACRIAEDVASRLGIPYYEDVALVQTKKRVQAQYILGNLPKEINLIILDDFVTTGSTLAAMHRLLEPYKKNMFFIVGINNNM